MSTTGTKILTGCGIGCLLLTILAVGAGWMGYRWVQTAEEAIENAEGIERTLVETYGKAAEYRPPVDGVVATDRLEVFLDIRNALAEEREGFAETISRMAPEDENGGGGGFRLARAVAGLPTRIFSFVTTRNQALLEHGMGFGEYTWIYWLSYHAWLGHPPTDSELHEVMRARSDSEGRMQIQIDGGPEQAGLAWRVRRDVGEMLKNLEADVAETPGQEHFHALVLEELGALEDDPQRIPWQDGLPDQIAVALSPYRDRFEATYSPASNPFELMDLD